jgi:GrpB-like predicted nucleotidyltransferase (UPF0157 family)
MVQRCPNGSEMVTRMRHAGEVLELFGEASSEPIVLVDYDPSWPARFAAIRDALRERLAPAARIEHVGSTAVAGLLAKPTIDVQISVPNLDDEDAYRPSIERLGWPLRSREPGHRLFRPPAAEPPVAHVHVCASGSEWERRHLLFVAYLRAEPLRAGTYGRLKLELAARLGRDRIAYTDAKDEFVAATLELAERWAEKTGWSP